jgi:hypothetical protein
MARATFRKSRPKLRLGRKEASSACTIYVALVEIIDEAAPPAFRRAEEEGLRNPGPESGP